MLFGADKLGFASSDETLAVLVDEHSGREYYVSMVDSFEFRDREYVVFYNYQAEQRSKQGAEIVLMRVYRDQEGDRYFTSIRSREELEMVFEIFFERFSSQYEDEIH
ncbi:MAG: DUF1292 domain-containing protein [Eubacteriales bacterium]|nr:DUF1292 domain-containing protein [Eubacteriales bacterium]